METEEVIKVVDSIYKNILEKFNPGARQLIAAGKSYLKSLHGTASASRLFNESLAKVSMNAQQGGTTDIGNALLNIVDVYKEIHEQHMNILKAFYVDLLVPLETNLEKDTKVIQYEQKRFLQQHKLHTDSYSKAMATMKKQRKKKNTAQNAEKEMKSIQALEEEKNKLDAFCEQSLRMALTQERRRYGFVLERQCSLAKHWMAYHLAGKSAIENQLDTWNEIAASREFLPPNVDNIYTKNMIENMKDDESDRTSIASALRKTRSIDASCLDMRSLAEVGNSAMNMPRAKSEFNLTSSVEPPTKWEKRPIVSALYAYLSSGENQLSFFEGDRIALVGERAKGWQFGENLRTHHFGWFPVAYIESDENEPHHSNNWDGKNSRMDQHSIADTVSEVNGMDGKQQTTMKMNNGHDKESPTRMFGDTIMYRNSKQFRGVSGGNGNGGPKPGPPPTLPAPVPTPVVPAYESHRNSIAQSQSFSSINNVPVADKRKSTNSNYNGQSTSVNTNKPKSSRDGLTNISLHSSNDSGFANEPPPQPEVDYSDDETVTRVPIRHDKYMETKRQSYPQHNGRTDTLQSQKHYKSASKLNGTPMDMMTMRQSASYGDLMDDKYRSIDRRMNELPANGVMVKRTKSFWKFGKNDEILEGMAMWRHRDLVLTETERQDEESFREMTLRRNKKNIKENGTAYKNRSNKKISSDLSIDESNSKYSDANEKSYEKKLNVKKTYSNGNDSISSSETLKNNMDDMSRPVIDDLTKYRITKADIDNRVMQHHEEQRKQKHHSMDDENIYGIEPEESQQVHNKSNGQHYKETTMKRHQQQQGYMTNGNNTANTNGNINSIKRNNDKNYYQPEEKNKRNKNVMPEPYIEDDFDDGSFMNVESVSNYYDDDSVQEVMIKTVKRHEILKQYCSSGTDTEQNSSSSDPYDCIVVKDQHKQGGGGGNGVGKYNGKTNNKTNKPNEMSTFRSNGKDPKNNEIRANTLLPRTKLSKPSNNNGDEITSKSNNLYKDEIRSEKHGNNLNNLSNSYGPWYNLWEKDGKVMRN